MEFLNQIERLFFSFCILILPIIWIIKLIVKKGKWLSLWNPLKWFFVAISISLYVKLFVFDSDIYDRLAGPYIATYIALLILKFPWLLFIPKLKGKFWSIVVTGILMNGGRAFEIFVIEVTSWHRDYLLQ